MEFIEYIKGIFFYIPKNVDDFIAKPYSAIYYGFLLFLLFTGRIALLFKTIIITIIFFAGFYYSVINPVGGNNIINIIIFASSALLVLIILLLNFILKGK